LKEASEGADRRSGSREFYANETAVEKAYDAKYEVTAGLIYIYDEFMRELMRKALDCRLLKENYASFCALHCSYNLCSVM